MSLTEDLPSTQIRLTWVPDETLGSIPVFTDDLEGSYCFEEDGESSGITAVYRCPTGVRHVYDAYRHCLEELGYHVPDAQLHGDEMMIFGVLGDSYVAAHACAGASGDAGSEVFVTCSLSNVRFDRADRAAD